MEKRCCSMDGDLVISQEIVMWVILNIGNISQSFPGGSDGKESAMQEIRVQSLSWEDPLEKEMATHFSILA